jgi:hypothetical protein
MLGSVSAEPICGPVFYCLSRPLQMKQQFMHERHVSKTGRGSTTFRQSRPERDHVLCGKEEIGQAPRLRGRKDSHRAEQLYNAFVHVFEPRNPRPMFPEFFFVLGCHKPCKPVSVLVNSGNNVSSHFLCSCCGGRYSLTAWVEKDQRA